MGITIVRSVAAASMFVAIAAAGGEDCDGNGVPDSAEGEVGFVEHTIAGDGAVVVDPTDVDSDGDVDMLVGLRSINSQGVDEVVWYENLDGSEPSGRQR